MLALKLAANIPVFDCPKRQRVVIQSAPVVTARHVLLASVFPKSGGEVVAIDRASLAVAWRMPHERWYLTPSHVLAESSVLFRDGEEAGILDLDPPHLVWSRPFSIVTAWDDGLVLDPGEGRPPEIVDWRNGQTVERLELPPTASMVAKGTILLQGARVGEDGHNYIAYDLGKRQPLWKRDIRSELREAHGADHLRDFSIIAGSLPDVAIGVNSSEKPFMVGLSVLDGAILWKANVPGYPLPSAIAGRLVYPAGGRLYVIDERTGEILHDREQPGLGMLDRVQQGAPFGDRVVFTTEGGQLVVCDVGSGIVLWTGDYKASLYGSAAADERLFVSAGDGTLCVYEGTDTPSPRKKKSVEVPPRLARKLRGRLDE